MTYQPITHGRTGDSLTSAPDAAHAFTQDGQIILRRFGRLEPVSRWEAISEVLCLDGSPYPSSQERARQIRAALRTTNHNDLLENHNGHAH